eukprot:7097589-Lingulodinium_polyedra.AAC.1
MAKGADATPGTGAAGVVTALPTSQPEEARAAPVGDGVPPLPPPSNAPSCVGEPEKSAGPAPTSPPQGARKPTGGSTVGNSRRWDLVH